MASHKALLITATTAMAVFVGALLPATTWAWPANHVVRENDGRKPDMNYDNWVKRFVIGDFNVGNTLQFIYFVGNHNVVMVGEDGYNACDETNSIRTWASGNDYVQLSDPGKFFFICVGDHCSRGMKLAVTVVSVM